MSNPTTVKVCETFSSIQGESSLAGMPCFFIRLSGCNLRCSYCDTKYAYEDGEEREIDGLVEDAVGSGLDLVEITGGEPLLQEGTISLAERLSSAVGAVMIETNGSVPITGVPDNVSLIMDMKCPSSASCDEMCFENLEQLRPIDEVKFVVNDKADYEWSKNLVAKYSLIDRCRAVSMSPVWGALDPNELSEWIIADKLRLKIQVQLHKVMGIK